MRHIHIHIPSSLSYQTCALIYTLFFFFFFFLFFFFFAFLLIFVAPALSFQAFTTDAEAKSEANECNAREDSKRQSFALGFDLGSGGEQ
jgi:ABC-type antimicrobial peptide transport system permease subunit